jgi:hypothetical protein
VKIKDVVSEAWGFGYDPKSGRAKGVLGRLASDLVGDQNYAAMGQKIHDKNQSQLAQKTAHQAADALRLAHKTGINPLIKTPSAFEQQFEIVDNDPPTVQYKNNTFQRDQYGKWIDFRTGKEAPERFATVLDRVSPPKETRPSATDHLPLMSPSAPKAATPSTWQQPTTGPAVWKSNRPSAQHAAEPAAPAGATATGKAHVKPTGDGGVQVTDKVGQTYVRPAGKDYWTNPQGGIYMPGSPEYQKLNATAGKK